MRMPTAWTYDCLNRLLIYGYPQGAHQWLTALGPRSPPGPGPPGHRAAKKKSDFGSYSLYLALHEVFLRYCTGSISVRYFQVARGLWQGLMRAAALL